MQMLHRRQASDFLSWLEEREATGFLEFLRFADGLRRDLPAVLAGLHSPYSNGRTEGFVNKLKTVKRQMYGRAGFTLLRHRLLLAA
jgi:transposase